MAAAITFYAGEGSTVNTLATGSGLGFYGVAGFGASVPVGQWPGRTFICNGDGTVQGPECDNVQPSGTSVAILGQAGSGIPLRAIPNERATFEVRFTNDTPVRVQNATFTLYDRVSVANPALGVTAAFYEVAHPDTVQNVNGSGGPSAVAGSGGAHNWTFFTPSGVTSVPLTASPGLSGLRPSGASTVSASHSWFAALSISPDSIGSHLSACYISLEFL